MKLKFITALCMAAAALLVAGCNSNKKAEAEAAAAAREAEIADSLAQVEMAKRIESAKLLVKDLPDEPVFDITTSLGTIKIKLYKGTPLHRENFAKLAMAGYYDGLLFHRIINDFMIQGGDPYTRDSSKVDLYGKGGPDYTIPAEFVPEYKHKKGALAAARRGDAANPMKESSGSQFYLVQSESGCSHLDGEYTVFGETVEGVKVIDKIAAVECNGKGLPFEPVRIESIKLDPECIKK